MPSDERLVLGWREWASLPQLGIPGIKAKVDTGARTSALHAFEVVPFTEGATRRVVFKIHPLQRNSQRVIECTADVIDERIVTDSGGHRERRLVIETLLRLGPHEWPIETTLTARDNMLFRMLLGRTAFRGRAVVDPSRSYLIGKKRKSMTAAT